MSKTHTVTLIVAAITVILILGCIFVLLPYWNQHAIQRGIAQNPAAAASYLTPPPRQTTEQIPLRQSQPAPTRIESPEFIQYPPLAQIHDSIVLDIRPQTPVALVAPGPLEVPPISDLSDISDTSTIVGLAHSPE